MRKRGNRADKNRKDANLIMSKSIILKLFCPLLFYYERQLTDQRCVKYSEYEYFICFFGQLTDWLADRLTD